MRTSFKATVLNRGGTSPFVDPVNASAYLTRDELHRKTDNPEVLDQNGANHLVVAVYPGYWHICQVSGYNTEDGMFCIVC